MHVNFFLYKSAEAVCIIWGRDRDMSPVIWLGLGFPNALATLTWKHT